MESNINFKFYKFLDISIVVFTMFPFIFLSYIYIISYGDIINFISENARMTISFIGVMTMPFTALVCKGIKKEVSSSNNIELVFLKFVIILISQILILNIIAIIFIGTLILNLYSKEFINIKNLPVLFRSNLTEFIGVILILVLALICFALGIRLM